MSSHRTRCDITSTKIQYNVLKWEHQNSFFMQPHVHSFHDIRCSLPCRWCCNWHWHRSWVICNNTLTAIDATFTLALFHSFCLRRFSKAHHMMSLLSTSKPSAKTNNHHKVKDVFGNIGTYRDKWIEQKHILECHNERGIRKKPCNWNWVQECFCWTQEEKEVVTGLGETGRRRAHMEKEKEDFHFISSSYPCNVWNAKVSTCNCT